MDAHLSRAQMLMSQNRHDQAEVEIRQALANDPDSFMAAGLLAICLAEQKRFDEATESAHRAIGLAPDASFPHYALAFVLQKRNRPKEAIEPLQEAIRIDPYDEHMFATLAGIHLNLKQWKNALEAANRGLEIDPESADCLNIKSIAQINLGQKAEAEASIASAMHKDPDDPVTHANLGWSKLEAGKHQEAMEHFREALRLDPNSVWARQGILEAMRSRNFVYRWMLKYFLFMSKLTDRMQWAVVIGFYVVYRVIRQVAQNAPAIAPFLWPILYLYIAFAIMSWIAVPLMNLVLRLDKFGRLVLSKEEIRTSNWVGVILLVTVGCLAAYFAGAGALFLLVAIAVGVMVFPVSRIYQCEPGWPRNVAYGFTAGMGLLGIAVVAFPFVIGFLVTTQQEVEEALGLGQGLMYLHLIAAFVSQFLFNWLATQRVRY